MKDYILVDNENAKEHWEFIDVNNKTVLDLGCGRWNEVEKVEDHWLTTPEHFISHGAKKVIAVDIDPSEILWFKSKFSNSDNYEFLCKSIDSTQAIIDLYDQYKPNCVKSDIETNEKYILNLTQEQFCSIDSYYIETHGTDLYLGFLEIFAKYNYTINAKIDLIHTRGYCKVIFATKNEYFINGR